MKSESSFCFFLLFMRPEKEVPLAFFCIGGLLNLGVGNNGAFIDLPVSDGSTFVESKMAGGDGGGSSFESRFIDKPILCKIQQISIKISLITKEIQEMLWPITPESVCDSLLASLSVSFGEPVNEIRLR